MYIEVYTGAQMKAIDNYAIETCGIDSLQLMENAAAGIVSEMDARLQLSGKNCVILCGRGNNGGDGFAAACMLSVRCAQVRIVCLHPDEALSADAQFYSEKAKLYNIERITSLPEALAAIAQADVVLDALYGFGFRGVLDGADAKMAAAVNAAHACVFSADIPSGVCADCGDVHGTCIRADVTVSFTGYKLSALLFDSSLYYGEIVVCDIGIPLEAKASETPIARVITDTIAHGALGERARNAHKGDFGKVFVLGGSPGMSGAVYLSAQAAIKSGAGLVCAGVPACLAEIMEIKTTEVMSRALSEMCGHLAYDEKLVEAVNAYDVLAFGMGAGRSASVAELLLHILKEIEKPIVLDADGLYALSQNMDALKGHGQTVVLTPHSGEMARLCGIRPEAVEADRIGCAKMLAQKYNLYVVLKGAYTVITSPDGDVVVNRLAGNSGMATAGSGDVLAGLCASLLSRTPNVFAALQAAVYLHACAGDLAARQKGEDGMTACDILEMLPYAIRNLRQKFINNPEGTEKYV